MYDKKYLLNRINDLHTTKLGAVRVKKNLGLNEENIVSWCKKKIMLPYAKVIKSGKNLYISTDDIIITVNSFSLTIITAHKK